MLLKTTRAVTVLDAPRFLHSSFCFAPLPLGVGTVGHLLRSLLVLFVVLFTCGDAVIGGVKRVTEWAFEAADTGGASSSARESHVQQLGGGVRRCLRQEDQPQLPLLSNLRRHWTEGSMSCVTVQDPAHSAASQGAHGMEGAASAGHGGRQPKNLHRDLLDGAVRDASRSTRFHAASLPGAKRARLPPSSLATCVLLRTLRAQPFAVGRWHHQNHQEQLVRSGSAYNTEPLSETILACQERAAPRQFR